MERIMRQISGACLEKSLEAEERGDSKQFELWAKAAFDIVGALRAIREAIQNENKFEGG